MLNQYNLHLDTEFLAVAKHELSNINDKQIRKIVEDETIFIREENDYAKSIIEQEKSKQIKYDIERIKNKENM